MVKKISMVSTLIYNNLNAFINNVNLVLSTWHTQLNNPNPNSCNMITSEVGYIANSKETSSNGSWVTKKVKSDY